MLCYDCSLAGNRREAVGLCHFCSAGLCPEHTNVVSEEIRTQVPVVKTLVLPRKARRLLCSVCRAAVEQLHGAENLQPDEGSPEREHELIVH